jgi:3-dehydroquinate dehydratase
MSQVLVLVHRSMPHGPLPDGAVFVPFETVVDAVVALKATELPAAIGTDGLAGEDLPALTAAIVAHAAPCIEVRAGAWDGESASPVAAACRGVISGFGVHGLRRAADLLLAGR